MSCTQIDSLIREQSFVVNLTSQLSCAFNTAILYGDQQCATILNGYFREVSRWDRLAGMIKGEEHIFQDQLHASNNPFLTAMFEAFSANGLEPSMGHKNRIGTLTPISGPRVIVFNVPKVNGIDLAEADSPHAEMSF